jgi:hypothetical protein
MKRCIVWLISLVCMILAGAETGDAVAAADSADAGRLTRLDDPNCFPIAVWLQNPANAGRYRAAGVNLYVGLWQGPTEEQLRALKQAGMAVVCDQNKVGLAHLNDPTIVGWMHGDEPDNAQSLGEGKGYGPPIPAEKIVQDYQSIRAADPTRPVMLNLGQGVAWDGWYGRGTRTNHPEDYPEYVKGCDIVSFDIYPACHDNAQVAGKLWYVAQGVERLVKWTDGKKKVWNCIECTHIGNPTQKATPHQVRCEVWMSIIHGSQGLIYFVHEWQPRFNEAALLSDPNMLAAVTAINHRIQALAPVLNSPSLRDGLTVTPTNAEVPVAAMMKRYAGATYLFAVAMRGQATRATFRVPGLTGSLQAAVLDEDRTIQTQDGAFSDDFQPWDAHLYRLAAAGQ